MKTVKHLFKKCKDSGRVYDTTRLAKHSHLRHWNEPSAKADGKAVQNTTTKLLQSRYDTEGEARAPLGAKQRQKFPYNQHTKPLEEISPGETVRVKLPGKERWTKGTCAKALDHRSYFVKVGDIQYRRNWRHLLKMGEPSTPEQDEGINPTLPASEENKPEKVDSSTTESRRSGRVRQAPVWHKDYDIRA